jgi:hypothetical protein
VIRNKNNSGSMVWVFKDSDAVSNFRKMEPTLAYNENLALACVQASPGQQSKSVQQRLRLKRAVPKAAKARSRGSSCNSIDAYRRS